VLMVATDGPCYGGSLLELERTCEALRARDGAPPVVAKDLYIHPVQVAQAVDRGADGVLLMATLVGHTHSHTHTHTHTHTKLSCTGTTSRDTGGR
jgi:indole-3-glycerol phosphate synthase